jgi:multicomponent Na+:H+ antiporter subunit G
MIVLDILTWLFLIGGAAFSIIGGIGILRMPDFYSRLHGGGITDTMGAALIIFGLMFQTGLTLATPKLAIILFFLLVVSPSSCHALAKSAIMQGLDPVTDKKED